MRVQHQGIEQTVVILQSSAAVCFLILTSIFFRLVTRTSFQLSILRPTMMKDDNARYGLNRDAFI